MIRLAYRILLLTTVIAFNYCYGAVDITKYLKVCNRNSVDLNDCMLEAVQDGIRVMSDGGIPEMGVPSVDPYHQKELKLEYKNNQIEAKMAMKDIYVEGLKDATVRDVKVRADEDKLVIDIDMRAPRISINGLYVGEGQYNVLKIDASGGFNSTMTDLVWTWKIEGIPVKRGADTYVKINHVYMRPDVGKMVSALSNDNPSSKELTDLGNRFLNENWRTLYRELLPYAQANWNRTGTRVANKIFLKIPYNQVFPY